MVKICKCGKYFKTKPSYDKKGQGNFCSRVCYNEDRKVPIEERFFRFVIKTDKCWNWTGVIMNSGYGQFSADKGKTLGAHRYSYELHNGKIKKGCFVLHKCDNPICVNPSHLFLGTHQDNMNDKKNKQRQAVGSKNGISKLTSTDIIKIRTFYKDKNQQGTALIFNVKQATISKILNRDRWKHI
jgi:hypothetical protein